MASVYFSLVNVTSLPCDFSNDDGSDNDDDDDDENDNESDDEIGTGDVSPNDTSVCGSDGNSYPAICHVIPNYANVHVLHAGRCDDNECRGGPVSWISYWPIIYEKYHTDVH